MDQYALCGARSHYIKHKDRIINPDDFISSKRVDPWLEFAYMPNGDPNTEPEIEYYESLLVGNKCKGKDGNGNVITTKCKCTDIEVVFGVIDLESSDKNCSSVDNTLENLY